MNIVHDDVDRFTLENTTGHFIVKCRDCGITISQCRCMSGNKIVTFGVCEGCLNKPVGGGMADAAGSNPAAPQKACGFNSHPTDHEILPKL